MQIIIKTLGEVQNERVSIEIGQSEAADILDQAERVGKVPALEAQVRAQRDDLSSLRGRVEGQADRIQDLVAENKRASDWAHGLEVKVGELTSERDALLLKGETDRAADHDLVIAARAERNAEKERADNMEAERDALLLRVREYDSDRKTEKQRADENRAWAERTEGHLKTRSRHLGEATEKLTRIQDQVWKDTLDHAMENRGQSGRITADEVIDLVDAVSAVRSIVGQP